MMWDLGDLYASPEAWTAAHAKALAEANKLDGYKGTLGKSAADMLTALNAISAVHKEVDRLGVYASLKGDEDVRVAPNQERQQLAQALAATLAEKTSWLTPEILAVGAEKVKASSSNRRNSIAVSVSSWTTSCAPRPIRWAPRPRTSWRRRATCWPSRTISTASFPTANCRSLR